MSTKKQPVDLNLISTAFHHGCMRVPQELVDEIMNMLCDDPSALRACSLTCRAMFASVRPLIHRKLYLNLQTDLIAMRIGDKQTGHALGFLTFMGERGLLRYTRQIHVGFLSTFTPDTLRPHLHHFQSLDRVHSLTIGSYAANKWARYFNTYFTHLYPSLTSLSLCFSSGHYRLLLQFVLQFPNLENLCLEHLVHQEEIPIYLALPAIPDKSPPLSGHLRLCDPEIGDAGQWVVDLAYNLPNGIKFRSIELEHFSGQHAQHIVNACGRTLENLIIVISGNGFVPELNLTAATGLRRLTLRTKHPEPSLFDLDTFFQALFTIKSPLFREFVIEVEKCIRCPYPPSRWWGNWSRLDRYLDGLFSKREGCRLIVRVHQRGAVKKRVMETFPRLVERGCFHFETFSSIERFWC